MHFPANEPHSDPEAEYQEPCNKAKAVMKAASLTGQFKT